MIWATSLQYLSEYFLEIIRVEHDEASKRFDELKVIRCYFGIPEKINKPIKTLNQEIYKQIRYRLDSNMRDYHERVEKGDAKKVM